MNFRFCTILAIFAHVKGPFLHSSNSWLCCPYISIARLSIEKMLPFHHQWNCSGFVLPTFGHSGYFPGESLWNLIGISWIFWARKVNKNHLKNLHVVQVGSQRSLLYQYGYQDCLGPWLPFLKLNRCYFSSGACWRCLKMEVSRNCKLFLPCWTVAMHYRFYSNLCLDFSE